MKSLEFAENHIKEIAESCAEESALCLTREILITTDEEYDLIKEIIKNIILEQFGVTS